MPICRSCGTKIEFIKTRKGNMMPVEQDSLLWSDLEDGMTVISEDGEVHTVGKSGFQDMEERDWFVSHFANCPQANDWRRR